MGALKKLVAGGGGSAEQEAAVLSQFASFVPKGGTVVSINWAQTDPAKSATCAWVSSTLATLGLKRVRTLTSLRSTGRELDSADAAFLCGGNTFLLMQRLRETGMGVVLAARVRKGMPCYGGSAGAIVMGSHIGTGAHADANDVGLNDLAGLDLFGGLAIWCHYTDADAQRIRLFRSTIPVPVIALPVNAGLTIDAGGIAAIGPGKVKLWQSDSNAEPIEVRAV